jgi:hypothetical protein
VPRNGAGGRRIGRGAGVGVGLLVLLFAGPALAREPHSSAVTGPQPGVVFLDEPCRSQVAAELRTGQIAAAGCDGERRLAQYRQLRGRRSREGFGLVERSRIQLGHVALILSEARGCRLWPLRALNRPVLGLGDARAAACWVRRYKGSLELAGVTADGRRMPRIATVEVDDEGRVDVDLGRLAIRLGRGGGVDFDALVRLELGADGWAGSVDLVVVRGLLADWHATSVQRGRGVPALLVVRHPEHASAERIRGIALADSLHRQEEDFEAVQRGSLAPYRFLERHAWSPYRHLVAALVGGH